MASDASVVQKMEEAQTTSEPTSSWAPEYKTHTVHTEFYIVYKFKLVITEEDKSSDHPAGLQFDK